MTGRAVAGALGLLLLATGAAAAEAGGDEDPVELVSEQVILIATVIGAVATLPTLIEFLIDRRKRKERIALSLDDVAVADLEVRLAGLDELLADIADLIDRARHPESYASCRLGNEMLIIGPNLSGKKTLALRIAKEAGMDRLIIVYNARNADALVKAKSLIQHYRHQKVMLLLPGLDKMVEHEDEEVLNELDALIDTSSGKSNVLVVGTAVDFQPGGMMDNMFGVVLAMPGTPRMVPSATPLDEEARKLLIAVARFYLEEAKKTGFNLAGIAETAAVDHIVAAARNPADVEDIAILSQTTALHRQRKGLTKTPEITAEIIEKSIRRVVLAAA
jgi:hypothetical protein